MNSTHALSTLRPRGPVSSLRDRLRAGTTPYIGLSEDQPAEAVHPARKALADIDGLLEESSLGVDAKLAVLLNAVVLVVSKMPEAGAGQQRGRIINATCDGLRTRLQTYLPKLMEVGDLVDGN